MRLILVIAVSACLACLGYAFIELGLAARSIASEFALVASETRGTLKDTSERIGAATDDFRIYQAELLRMLSDPQVQRSIGLLLRTGDDLSRAVKKFNATLDDLHAGIKATNININDKLLPQIAETVKNTDANLNGRVLPAATATLDRATAVLVELESQTKAVGGGLAGLTTEATRTTVAINAMVAGPLTETAGNVERGTLAAEKTLDNLQVWTERLRKSRRWILDALISGARWFKP